MQFNAQDVLVARSGMTAEQFVQHPRLLLGNRAVADGGDRVIELPRWKGELHDAIPSGFAAFSMQDWSTRRTR